MKFALGKKSHMTQIFDEIGNVKPVTIVTVQPMAVSGLKMKDRDGYDAVVVGTGTKNKISKGKKIKVPFVIKEFKTDIKSFSIGDALNACDVFSIGDIVKVSAVSKGKGFQGVVKRYGFSGGPRTHGQKHNERAPGSIGFGRARVAKGKKMPGRMGSDRVTIKKIEILDLNKEEGYIVLKGSIPGRRGSIIEIQTI